MSDLAAQLAHYRVTHVPTPVGPVVAWLPPIEEDMPPPTRGGIQRLLEDLAAVGDDELDDFESDLPDAEIHEFDRNR